MPGSVVTLTHNYDAVLAERALLVKEELRLYRAHSTQRAQYLIIHKAVLDTLEVVEARAEHVSRVAPQQEQEDEGITLALAQLVRLGNAHHAWLPVGIARREAALRVLRQLLQPFA